jgi:hypothetical protein
MIIGDRFSFIFIENVIDNNLWYCFFFIPFKQFTFIFIKTKVKRQIKTLLLYLLFLHMKFKDINKIKIAISETL